MITIYKILIILKKLKNFKHICIYNIIMDFNQTINNNTNNIETTDDLTADMTNAMTFTFTFDPVQFAALIDAAAQFTPQVCQAAVILSEFVPEPITPSPTSPFLKPLMLLSNSLWNRRNAAKATESVEPPMKLIPLEDVTSHTYMTRMRRFFPT